MRFIVACLVVFGGVVAATTASAQNTAATDVYHVHFTKAAPGQAAALAKSLMVPDKTSPMPEHFVVLRHQEGDDWDFVVIQHLGAKTEVTATAPPPSDSPAGTVRVAQRYVRERTFVGRVLEGDVDWRIGQRGRSGVCRGRAARRPRSSRAAPEIAERPGPSSKIQTGNVLLQHLEGGEWTFATLTRYNSWQDFATERAAAAAAGDSAGGWADIRQHSAFHRDTIADRIYPAK